MNTNYESSVLNGHYNWPWSDKSVHPFYALRLQLSPTFVPLKEIPAIHSSPTVGLVFGILIPVLLTCAGLAYFRKKSKEKELRRKEVASKKASKFVKFDIRNYRDIQQNTE